MGLDRPTLHFRRRESNWDDLESTSIRGEFPTQGEDRASWYQAFFSEMMMLQHIRQTSTRWKKYGSRSIQSRGLMCFLLKTKYQNMHHLNLIDQNMWNQDRKQIIPKKMLPLFYHRPWLPLGSSCPTWVQPRTENFLLLGDVGSTEGVFCRVIDEEIRMSSRMYETIIYLSLKYNCPIPSLIYFALSIYIYTLIYVYRLC